MNEMICHADCIAHFRNLIYDGIIKTDDLVSKKKVINLQEKHYGYFFQSGLELFFLPDKFVESLPLKVLDSTEVDYRNDVFQLVTKVKPISIPVEKKMEFRELVDTICAFEHTNPIHFKLYRIVCIAAYIDRLNFRVSTEAGFGKDSVVNVISGLCGDVANVYGATFAKLEYVLKNKFILFNEMGNLKPDDRSNMQQFLLAIGAFFSSYTKRTRKCYDENTRVLTKDGFVYHNEVGNREIMVINPKTRKLNWEKPIDLFQTKVTNENVVKFKYGRGVDICVTPEHKMQYSTGIYKNKHNWKEGTAKQLFDFKAPIFINNFTNWGGKFIKYIEIPKREKKWCNVKNSYRHKIWNKKSIEINTWCNFLGWFISEGHVTKGKTQMIIGQSKKENIKKIRNCLDDLNIKYKEYLVKVKYIRKDGKIFDMAKFVIINKQVCEYLADNVGSNSRNMRIPSYIKNLPKKQLKILFNSLMLGDGSFGETEESRMRYYSINKHLCEDVQEIAMKLGYNVHISERKRKGAFVVNISKDTLKYLRSNNKECKKYTGKIYCFTTSTGYYVTERNGSVAFQGNTESTLETYDVSKLSLGIVYNLPEYYIEKDQPYFDQMFTKAVINRFIPFVFEGRLTTKFEQEFNIPKFVEENKQVYKDLISTLNYFRRFGCPAYNCNVDLGTDLKRYQRTLNILSKYIWEYSENEKEYDELFLTLLECYKKYGELI